MRFLFECGQTFSPDLAFSSFKPIQRHHQDHLTPFSLRPIIPEVVEFMDCRDFANGFARVRCDHCAHEPNRAGAR